MLKIKLASTKEEIDFLFEVRTHPDVDKMLSGQAPKSIEDHYAYIDKNQEKTRYIYVVYDESTMIGYSQMYDIREGQYEVGFALHPNFHGKGLGKKMVEETVRFLLNLFPSKKQVLYVKEDNPIAANIYRKMGFEEKGRKDGLIYMEL